MALPPFRAERYDLRVLGRPAAMLEPFGPATARDMAARMTGIDPWARLGTDAAGLANFLAGDDPHCCCRLIVREGVAAGAVAVRSPWLYGPYLSLLAVLPGHQGQGLGAAVLDWMAEEARESAANLWVCTSSFNARAQAFYEANGFRAVGQLDGLLKDGFDEVLLRKRLPRKT